MNELKFKAYVPALNKTVNVIGLNPLNKTVYLSHWELFGREGDDVLMNFHEDVEDHVTVRQYTGLKDKEGEEIYAGDIVSLSEEFDENKFYAIEWQINGYWLDGWDGNEYGFPDENNLEVIGDIWENPELLVRA